MLEPICRNKYVGIVFPQPRPHLDHIPFFLMHIRIHGTSQNTMYSVVLWMFIWITKPTSKGNINLTLNTANHCIHPPGKSYTSAVPEGSHLTGISFTVIRTVILNNIVPFYPLCSMLNGLK